MLKAGNNERDLLLPAIRGTTSNPPSHSDEIERVVVASSFAALIDMDKGFQPGYTYSEVD